MSLQYLFLGIPLLTWSRFFWTLMRFKDLRLFIRSDLDQNSSISSRLDCLLGRYLWLRYKDILAWSDLSGVLLVEQSLECELWRRLHRPRNCLTLEYLWEARWPSSDPLWSELLLEWLWILNIQLSASKTLSWVSLSSTCVFLAKWVTDSRSSVVVFDPINRLTVCWCKPGCYWASRWQSLIISGKIWVLWVQESKG